MQCSYFTIVVHVLQSKSRILPTDVVLPLNPTASHGPVNVTHSDLTSWRHYIMKAREMHHSLDESMQKVSCCKAMKIATLIDSKVALPISVADYISHI